MKGLKNRDLITELCQVPGAGQAAGAGADHRHLFPVRLLRRLRHKAMLSGPVGHKTLQLSDGNRLSLDAADALPLTLRLLRADTAAYRRQSRRLRYHAGSLLNLSLLYLFDKRRDIDCHRAACDTFGILTI